MKIKSGVRLTGIQPQMVLAAIICEGVYKKYGVEFVITSGIEGKHSGTSRHYLGFAIDARTRDFSPSDLKKVESDLKDALGDEFFVLFEGNHFHISFKPRTITG